MAGDFSAMTQKHETKLPSICAVAYSMPDFLLMPQCGQTAAAMQHQEIVIQ